MFGYFYGSGGIAVQNAVIGGNVNSLAKPELDLLNLAFKLAVVGCIYILVLSAAETDGGFYTIVFTLGIFDQCHQTLSV